MVLYKVLFYLITIFFVGRGEQFVTFDLIRTIDNTRFNLILGNILYIMNVIPTYYIYQLCPKYIPHNTSFLKCLPKISHKIIYYTSNRLSHNIFKAIKFFLKF